MCLEIIRVRECLYLFLIDNKGVRMPESLDTVHGQLLGHGQSFVSPEMSKHILHAKYT